MTCPAIQPEDLVALADGELTGTDLENVENHVAGCSACARDLELLIATGDLLAGLPAVEASPGFVDHVMSATRGPATSQRAPASPAGRVFALRPARIAIAAALLAGVAGVWWLGDAPEPVLGPLTAQEEQDIAQDLYILSSLDALEAADAEELAQLVNELDLLENDLDLYEVQGG